MLGLRFAAMGLAGSLGLDVSFVTTLAFVTIFCG
jgi:hypothetical protein